MSTRFPQSPQEDGTATVKTWQQAVVLSIVVAHGHPVSSATIAEITGATRNASNHLLRSLAQTGMLERAGTRRVGEALEWLWVITDLGRRALRRPRCVALLVLVGGTHYVLDDAQGIAVAALDGEGWDEVAAIVDKARQDLIRVMERTATRRPAAHDTAN